MTTRSVVGTAAGGPPSAAAVCHDFEVGEFVSAQRRAGRGALDASALRHWSARYRAAAAAVGSGGGTAAEQQAALLLREITYPLAMQESSPIPSYYPYTCVNVLNWWLDGEAMDATATKQKLILGIVALLVDLGEFELRSLIGCEPFQTVRFDATLALSRIARLPAVYARVSRLAAMLPKGSPELPQRPRRYDGLFEFVVEPHRLSALVTFSCMPQTGYHDEVVFLRAVHISELCFLGIRVCVMQAIEAIREGTLGNARAALDEAVVFARILHDTFEVLRTMPPAHFHDFRLSAANASAVQSANYQLLELLLFGSNEQKAGLFERVPHLRVLRESHHGSCFRDVLAWLHERYAGDGAPVLDAAAQLDRALLTWRGLHVGFARAYLSDAGSGTGGTVGAAYLKQFLRNTFLPEAGDCTQVHGTTCPEVQAGVWRLAPGADVIAPAVAPLSSLE